MTNWTYISDLDASELYNLAREDEHHSSTTALFLAFLPAVRQALAGAAGTAVSNVLVYPLDLVVTRLKVQRRVKSQPGSALTIDERDRQYSGITDAVQKLYRYEGGAGAFYSGVIPDTIKSVADSFFFFLAYNVLRKGRKRWPRAEHPLLQVLDQISLGMTAGAFSKLLTTPIQIVVTRKQLTSVASAKKSTENKPHILGRQLSVRQIIEETYRNNGILGFWSGYSASLLLTLNPALTFFLDSFLRRTLRVGQKSNPGITFLIAAIGKSTASATLYPLSLAKSRAQAEAANSNDVQSDEQQSSEKGTTPSKRRAKTANVVSSILQIAANEGALALYAGLIGEVLKGFFSHGLTMVIKHRISSFVIKLYYALALRLRRTKVHQI